MSLYGFPLQVVAAGFIGILLFLSLTYYYQYQFEGVDRGESSANPTQDEKAEMSQQ